jgi:hypothetical protein
MPQSIVHAFKVVDVYIRDRQRRARSVGSGNLGLGQRVEMLAVCYLGQRICPGQCSFYLEALLELRQQMRGSEEETQPSSPVLCPILVTGDRSSPMAFRCGGRGRA